MAKFMLSSRFQKIVILIILYLGFISLGLPDQALGVAWPSMRGFFGLPLDAAGVLLFFAAILSAVSSFCSGYFLKRYSIITVLVVSCFLTIIGLGGYGLAPNWLFLILATIPFGVGAGAIDAGLNDYVAKNYSSRQMNWLHGCWGIGASLGPAIMTYALVSKDSWRYGYLLIVTVQITLLLFFITTAGFWKKVKPGVSVNILKPSPKLLSLTPILSMLMFFIYTCVEASISIWFYSVMVEQRGISVAMAGTWLVMYWSFLTIGRFSIGFFSNRLGNRRIITYGLGGALFFIGLLMWSNNLVTMLSLCGLGFCLAGIYPSMMHETPQRFGHKLAATMTGYQAGMAALGVALLAPLVGIIISNTNLQFLLPILLLLVTIMLLINKMLNART